jgi:hypothetical protein
MAQKKYPTGQKAISPQPEEFFDIKISGFIEQGFINNA